MPLPILCKAQRTVIGLVFTTILLFPFLARSTEHWFSIRGKPEFADVQAQLQVVVNEHAQHARNRFCVVGDAVGSLLEAWVYWSDGGKLILWRPDFDNPHAIAGSNRYLDLGRDVVAGDDVGGSTYKLTRATADGIITACRHYGDEYVIDRRFESTPHG